MNSEFEIVAAALAVGLALGYLIGSISKGKRKPAAATEPLPSTSVSDTEWWKLRDTLTGTQMQILQHLEARKEATIASLQEKFSFIPDRELYYRLEQIVLMGFIKRERKQGEVVYTLNADYSGRVEDDKTIILPEA